MASTSGDVSVEHTMTATNDRYSLQATSDRLRLGKQTALFTAGQGEGQLNRMFTERIVLAGSATTIIDLNTLVDPWDETDITYCKVLVFDLPDDDSWLEVVDSTTGENWSEFFLAGVGNTGFQMVGPGSYCFVHQGEEWGVPFAAGRTKIQNKKLVEVTFDIMIAGAVVS